MCATMKCVLMIPDTDIQPRAISSTTRAYRSSDAPSPSYSSGMVSPNRPSFFIPATIWAGYSSRCSSSVATGMISLDGEVPDRGQDVLLELGQAFGLGQASHGGLRIYW